MEKNLAIPKPRKSGQICHSLSPSLYRVSTVWWSPYLFFTVEVKNAFMPIFERGLGRVSKRHVRGKSIGKKRFYGIYIEIKQLEVGHNVITMKLECHLKWFSTTSTIEGLGKDSTLNSTTRVPRTLCTFSTLWYSSRPEKKCFGKIP